MKSQNNDLISLNIAIFNDTLGFYFHFYDIFDFDIEKILSSVIWYISKPWRGEKGGSAPLGDPPSLVVPKPSRHPPEREKEKMQIF